MPGFLAAAAPAIVSGVASLVGGHSANKATARLVQYQTEFQREMANTAHQRQVADLRAAGLNPILSAGGGGAHSPSGASARMEDIVTPAIGSALSARMAMQEMKNLKEQEHLLRAQKFKAEYEGGIQRQLFDNNANYLDASTNAALQNVRAQTELTGASAVRERDFNESMGGTIRALGPLGQVLGPIIRLLGGGK